MFIYRLQKILSTILPPVYWRDTSENFLSLTLCFAQPINILNERFAYKKI